MFTLEKGFPDLPGHALRGTPYLPSTARFRAAQRRKTQLALIWLRPLTSRWPTHHQPSRPGAARMRKFARPTLSAIKGHGFTEQRAQLNVLKSSPTGPISRWFVTYDASWSSTIKLASGINSRVNGRPGLVGSDSQRAISSPPTRHPCSKLREGPVSRASRSPCLRNFVVDNGPYAHPQGPKASGHGAVGGTHAGSPIAKKVLDQRLD